MGKHETPARAGDIQHSGRIRHKGGARNAVETGTGEDGAMRPRVEERLAVIVFGLCFLCYSTALVLDTLDAAGTGPGGLSSDKALFLGLLLFPLVGALIASRQPSNTIAWILLGIGLSWEFGTLVGSYATYRLSTSQGSISQAELVFVALTTWWWVPAVGLMGTFLILLFPDGRLPSPRWRIWAWLSATAMIVNSLTAIIMPGGLANGGFPGVPNPLGIEALRPIRVWVEGSVVLLVVCVLGCVVGLVRRFRRSRGQERLQLKWLTTAGAVAAGAFASLIISSAFVDLSGSKESPAWSGIAEDITFSSFLLIPLAIGIAVLRYRLYEIDRIINRTLVFGALTAILAATYAAIVTLAGTIVGGSELITAGATLVVAALFQPLRRWIQGFIDRRFYRRKYDAVRTIEAFSSRLRDEVDLEAMRLDLLAAAQETMQPRQASIWLRKS